MICFFLCAFSVCFCLLICFPSLILHLIERASSAPLDTCSSARNGNQKSQKEEPIKEDIIQAGSTQKNENGKLLFCIYCTVHLEAKFSR